MIRKNLWRVLGAGLILGVPVAHALDVNGYSSVTNDRFAGGFPASPQANTNVGFVGYGFDWSGVGWTPGLRNLALLSPRHAAYAAHWPDGANTIAFTQGTGDVFSVGVTNWSGGLAAHNDLAVATLKTDIPADKNVFTYAIYFNGYLSGGYLNKDFLVYGNTARVGRATLNYFGDVSPSGTVSISSANNVIVRKAELVFSNDYTVAGQAHPQAGDSGSPTFLVENGRMYLVGTHWAILTNDPSCFLGLDNFYAGMLPEISQEMLKTGWLPEVYTPVTHTWTGGTSTNWSLKQNWGGVTTPNDGFYTTTNNETLVTTVAVVQFNETATRHTVNVNANVSVTGLRIHYNTNDVFRLTGASVLSLGEAGLRNTGAGRQTVDVPINLRTDQRWTIEQGGLTINGVVSNQGWTVLAQVESESTLTVAGGLTGTGGLAKAGGGLLTLSRTNSYTGTTWIHEGTLRMAGQSVQTNTARVLVASNAVVSGFGALVPTGGVQIAAGGVVAPGDDAAVGTLTLGTTYFAGGSRLTLQVWGVEEETYDRLVCSGDLTMDGPLLTLSLQGGYMPSLGDVFTVIQWTGSQTGAFAALDLPSLSSGLEWAPSLSGDERNFTLEVIPEPSIAGLMAVALAGWAWLRRYYG